MDKEKLIQHLNILKLHYKGLSELMDKENKEKYSIEHNAKVKFINLLLINIKNGCFD